MIYESWSDVVVMRNCFYFANHYWINLRNHQLRKTRCTLYNRRCRRRRMSYRMMCFDLEMNENINIKSLFKSKFTIWSICYQISWIDILPMIELKSSSTWSSIMWLLCKWVGWKCTSGWSNSGFKLWSVCTSPPWVWPT